MATLTKARDEHDRATERLSAAMEDEHTLADRYERTMGSPQELDAYIRLRAARRQVSACSKWLEWVDDEDSPTAPPADGVPLEAVLGH
jgi:hypothetical protein